MFLGVQLVVSFCCSSMSEVLFDNPGISKCLNTYFCRILIFDASKALCMFLVMIYGWVRRLPHGPNKYMFCHLEAESKGFDPIKLA